MQHFASIVSLCALAATASSQTWTENGDAGQLPGTAQATVGAGSLSAIQGQLDASTDVDMFAIKVTNFGSFQATTVGLTSFDTALFLFNSDGNGVTFNDDDDGGFQSTVTGAFLPGNGCYLLAISRYDNDPVDAAGDELWMDAPFAAERAPDGPGAANPVDDWSDATILPAGDYRIALDGAEFAEMPLRVRTRSGRIPGSVLIFPVHRSGPNWLTILNVTNTSTEPMTNTSFGGSTNLHFEYANVHPNPNAAVNPLDAFMPAGCVLFDRIEFVTPADTISVLTTCHNAFHGEGQEGYVVVSAEDPARSMGGAWSHNHLIGSEVVLSASGVTYMLNAISVEGLGEPGSDLTSGDFPHTLEFNGDQYAALPDYLMSDFIGAAGSQLSLVNLSGNDLIENTLSFEVYNDNELPLSATLRFRCWFDQRLDAVNPLFSEANLANFPNDLEELDLDCDDVGDIETGWFIVQSTGTFFSDGVQHSPDGVILGAITAGNASVRGGHLLWEAGRQANGAFRTP